jgi:hypothetical protein
LTPFSLAYTNNALVVPMNAALAVSDISIWLVGLFVTVSVYPTIGTADRSMNTV